MDGLVGEVRLFAGGFTPRNWTVCDGSIFRIESNTALFSVIGTFFGGNGRETFGVPDLRGRVALGATQGTGLLFLGEEAGTERVRTMTVMASAAGGSIAMVNSVIDASGNNVQPVLGLNYLMCQHGKYPSRVGGEVEGTIGEIRLFGGNYAPDGWALCDGSVVSIDDPLVDYTPLFQLIGNFYGGDGQATFAMPDLRDRVPVGVGQGNGLSSYQLGQAAGSGEVATESIPVSNPQGNVATVHSVIPADANNLQPSLGLNYMICVKGIFPGS